MRNARVVLDDAICCVLVEQGEVQGHVRKNAEIPPLGQSLRELGVRVVTHPRAGIEHDAHAAPALWRKRNPASSRIVYHEACDRMLYASARILVCGVPVSKVNGQTSHCQHHHDGHYDEYSFEGFHGEVSPFELMTSLNLGPLYSPTTCALARLLFFAVRDLLALRLGPLSHDLVACAILGAIVWLATKLQNK